MRIPGFMLIGTVLLSAIACGNVNHPITIEDGQQVEGSQSTVNGAIRVGNEARVEGNLETVNGAVEIGEDSHVGRVETVNGRITLGAGSSAESLGNVNGSIVIEAEARVSGDVRGTSGSITLASGSQVDGAVSTTSGLIRLDGARAGSVRNVSGGMELLNDCRVDGELRVGSVDRERARVPEVIIGEGCRVEGPLVFERDVRLRVHESAQIGEVRGASVEPLESGGSAD